METIEINKALSHIKSFVGTFPRDRLPKYVGSPSACVINTDLSSAPGAHWVAIYIDEFGDGEYYDSFGLPPQHKEIVEFLDRNCFNRWSYNNQIIQEMSPESLTCGNYCVLIIDLRSRGISFCNLLRMFTDNRKSNDQTVSDII